VGSGDKFRKVRKTVAAAESGAAARSARARETRRGGRREAENNNYRNSFNRDLTNSMSKLNYLTLISFGYDSR